MVKIGSPFELLGVVDSSFPRSGGRTCPSVEASQETNVWKSELPNVTQAGAAMLLAKAIKRDMSPNHQKFGRPPGYESV